MKSCKAPIRSMQPAWIGRPPAPAVRRQLQRHPPSTAPSIKRTLVRITFSTTQVLAG
jgi:hypothetical protein